MSESKLTQHHRRNSKMFCKRFKFDIKWSPITKNFLNLLVSYCNGWSTEPTIEFAKDSQNISRPATVTTDCSRMGYCVSTRSRDFTNCSILKSPDFCVLCFQLWYTHNEDLRTALTVTQMYFPVGYCVLALNPAV